MGSVRLSIMERLKARMCEEEEEEEKEKEEAREGGRLSKKKLKLATRLSVAALKQLVGRPDVVEMQVLICILRDEYLIFL